MSGTIEDLMISPTVGENKRQEDKGGREKGLRIKCRQ